MLWATQLRLSQRDTRSARLPSRASCCSAHLWMRFRLTVARSSRMWTLLCVRAAFFCVIYVSRSSQKPIIIGNQGAKIKKVGTEARKEIEEFIGKKVFLDLFVKVHKDWRDKEKDLKKFGY